MDLALLRSSKRPDGIFSSLLTMADHEVCMTLEHAYLTADGYEPKLIDGTFSCVRGAHRLHGMVEDFETFEIAGVPGHTGMLFHWGNINRNSDGCVLTGDAIADVGASFEEMITNSRHAFARFMELQKDCKSFLLTVS